MAAPIPTTEPTSVIAGDTATWRKTLPDYPADQGWALSYDLLGSEATLTINALADGTDHLLTVAPATTRVWPPGVYQYRAKVSSATEVFTIGRGTLTVEGAFNDTDVDQRSHARRALANIEAYLENSANLQAASYQIAGRQLQRHSLEALLSMRDRYRAEVTREDAAQRLAQGLPDKRRVYVRFGP